jgi:hypothetical protein
MVAIGSFSHKDAVGANRFRFSGRVNGHALAPGKHTLRVVATAGGLSSKPARAGFRIKKKP